MMKQLTPLLKLTRLIIFTNNGERAYDETFHSGVNIIRGNNSSGKSTILNFIYYVLGGDLRKWTKAAEECAVVYGEIEINGAKITLRRHIEPYKIMQPMSIFWGNFEQAITSLGENWEVYGYKKSTDKKSFSNALFVALGFPELKGDIDSNITMHQILRLMYSDQRSLTQDLLMTESFDSSITRQTIGDLLFGIYDDYLYTEKLLLRDYEKEYDIINQQVSGIKRIYTSAGNKTAPKEIEKEIEEQQELLGKINECINQTENANVTTTEIENVDNIRQREELIQRRKRLDYVQESIINFEYEIFDSTEFISSLEKRLEALNEAILTRDELSCAELVYCPHCLSPIDKKISEPGKCFLCKQNLPEDHLKSQLKRMQQEIDNQIRESKALLKRRENELLQQKSEIPTLNYQISTLQKEIQYTISSIRTTDNTQKEKLYIKKGELTANINFLTKQLTALQEITALADRLEQLAQRIKNLKQSISERESQQTSRFSEIRETVNNITHIILNSDLGRQDDFKKAERIEFDCKSNTFSFGGKNNFSESSVVFLKNSILYAIFFTSTLFSYFRYPRFFLCDNTEDKGMEDERSQSFQKKIVDISQKCSVDHQIIFSTSKIAEELNNGTYCVGEYYTAQNHSLKHVNV